jgi:hypothetical protein
VRTPTRTTRRMPTIAHVTLMSRSGSATYCTIPPPTASTRCGPRYAGGHRGSTSSSGPDHEDPLNRPVDHLPFSTGEPAEGWPSFWSPRGGRRHLPRGPAGPAARRGRLGSAGVETAQVVALEDRIERSARPVVPDLRAWYPGTSGDTDIPVPNGLLVV